MDQLLNLIFPPAFAETAMTQGPQQGGGLSFMMMLAIFVVFIYFGIWRPQSKRAKEQSTLLNSLTKGDEVVTAGGMLGKINKLHEQYVVITIGNNVDIILQKNSVVSILPKGTLKTLE